MLLLAITQYAQLLTTSEVRFVCSSQQKNQANIAKHELDFADASRVFRLPLRVSLDERQYYGEDRWIGIGILDGRVVVIVFTELGDQTIRIISLRKATPYERKSYEYYLKNELGES